MMILQMVADGKISTDEADQLLQAIEETERATESAAAESVRSSEAADGRLPDLGATIDQVVKETLRGLDESLEHLKGFSDHPHQARLRHKVEEKMRRVAERATQQATEAAMRAERVAERATERAERMAERMTERMTERGFRFSRAGETFFKLGLSVDKVSTKRIDQLTIPAAPNDRLILQNRVGDITIHFADTDQIAVEANLTVWGEDDEDAQDRAAATDVQLVRTDEGAKVVVTRPTLVGIGIMQTQNTRIDLTVTVPHGTNLEVSTKVGDLRVESDRAPRSWNLLSKVGNIHLVLPAAAGFAYDLKTKLGQVTIETDMKTDSYERGARGQFGEGPGSIAAEVKAGSIHIQRQ
jgi:hypothetical protein